ncbi:protein KRI1 homolog [Pollicipes pollicipes]|uniref:protein KRI1 homolog n=1 Tax=Pollicipes pollicipes TaxID=41117 RepID=UPI0018852F5D|nr:protein KRI1 homolog [Pollicipes pollicipes]
MQAMFGEDYYYGAENDEEKPVFDDDEDWDNWDPATEDAGEPAAPTHQDTAAPACEQPGFVMDCEYDGRAATQRQLLEATGRGRKKRRGKLAEMLRRPKPRFQPGGDQALAEYIDQYYRLDEALNPHPFQYRQVTANDFGLDATEVSVWGMANLKKTRKHMSRKRKREKAKEEGEGDGR